MELFLPMNALGRALGGTDETEMINDGPEGPDVSGEVPLSFPPKTMVAVGSLPVFRASLPCVVIAEDWPAWLLILPALGAEVLVVIGKRYWLDTLEMKFGWTLGSLEATQFLEGLSGDTWLFVSGSSIFLKNLVVGLKGVMNLTVALGVDNSITASLQTLLPQVHWVKV